MEKNERTIYAPKGAPRWMIEHEQKHCEGWQHG